MLGLHLGVTFFCLFFAVLVKCDNEDNDLREALRRLERKVDQISSTDPIKVAAEALALASTSFTTTTTNNNKNSSPVSAALRLEQQALGGLDAQLLQLKTELTTLVRRRDRDAAAADDVAELRAEAAALQSEVRKLKADVERLRERRERDLSTLGQLRTGQVAQRWLHKSVEELRTELRELASVQNVSAALRQRQQWEAALALLRSDAASLRADQDELRAGHEKHAAVLRQLQQDVVEARTAAGRHLQAGQLLRQELSQMKQEMLVRESDPVSKHMKTNNDLENHITGSDDLWNYVTGFDGKKHRLRHHGGLRAEVFAVIAKQAKLEEQMQEMKHNQSAMDAIAEQTRLQMSLLINETHRGAEMLSPLERNVQDLSRRLTTMEQESISVHEAMRNASVAVNGVEKLHTSTVQLFEALEALETECDRGVGTLRREMSKVEFNVAQMASTVNVLKEDQTTQSSALQTARRTVAQLQGRVDTQDYRLSVVEVEGVNATLRRCKETNEQLLVQSKLHQLEEDVNRIHQQEPNPGPAQQQNLSSQLPAIASHLAQLEDANLKLVRHLPSDCGEVQPSSADTDGVFLIHPPGTKKALEVQCEFRGSGAWTIFQRRLDNKVDFHRTWDEYRTGFGDAGSSYWLGNEALHALTSSGDHQLRVELWDTEGNFRYVEYRHFAVDSQDEGYKLRLSGYSGNASDALRAHDGMLFSTKDRDLDHSGSTNCAQFYSGGWWYNRCQQANANGHFDVGFTWYNSDQHVWMQLARVQMALRRKVTN